MARGNEILSQQTVQGENGRTTTVFQTPNGYYFQVELPNMPPGGLNLIPQETVVAFLHNLGLDENLNKIQ